MHRRTMARIAVATFVVVVLVFFVLAIVKAWDATDGELPSVVRLVGAAALWAAGLIAGAYAWAALLGGDRRVEHAAAFLVSQLGKYAPGGVWQATGQVGLARSAGVPLTQGATAFSVLGIAQAAAGCTWALLLAITWTDARPVIRILIAVGAVVALVVIDRRWMVWTLRKIPRTRDASDDLVPSQPAILRAFGAGLLLVGATSVAYLIMLTSFGPVDQPWFVIAAYAAAWTIGFIAVPIPAGVGVREAVLVAILHGMFPTSVLVAASVYLRFSQVAAEGLLAAGSTHWVRPSRLRAVGRGDDGPGAA